MQQLFINLLFTIAVLVIDILDYTNLCFIKHYPVNTSGYGHAGALSLSLITIIIWVLKL